MTNSEKDEEFESTAEQEGIVDQQGAALEAMEEDGDLPDAPASPTSGPTD